MARLKALTKGPQATLEILDSDELLKRVGEELPQRLKVELKKEALTLVEKVNLHIDSGLGIGETLCNIQTILKKERAFKYFLLHAPLGFKIATAYRYMTNWKKNRKAYPLPVLRAAQLRNIPLDPTMVKVLPPPKSDKPEVINQYLDELRNREREERQEITDKEFLIREVVNYTRTRLERLDNRSKSSFLRKVQGMQWALIGVSEPQTISPQALPEDLYRERGRPRKVIDQTIDEQAQSSTKNGNNNAV